ncbi:MAG: Efflux ABC transporter, permease protein, partial [uncultured Thermoleophilia bacterium]
ELEPHEPDRHHDHRRRGRRAAGHLLDVAAGQAQRPLGRAHLRLAGDAEGQARPRAAPRRDDHPGDVRPDVHLHLRWGHLRVHRRLPGLPAPGHPGDVCPLHHRLLRGRPQHRPHQGGGRPVPLVAHRPVGSPPRLAARRQRSLPAVGDGDHRARRDPRLPARRRHRRCGRRAGPGGPVRLWPVVGLHDAGAPAALAQRGDERRLHGDLPADLPVQRLRRAGDAAVGAQGLRRGQPDLAAGHRLPRPDGRHGAGRAGRRGARRRGRAHRGVRPADDAALPPEL